MKKYFSIWWMMVKNSLRSAFVNKLTSVVFILGKVIRFVFSLVLILLITRQIKYLGGFTSEQVVFFFLSFNFVDMAVQMLFREVYRFRNLVVSGDFDLVLTRPTHPFLRILFGGTDILDMITLLPLAGFLAFWANNFHPSLQNILLYAALILNAILLAMAFHICVLAIGILTTAVDHTIMIYRDLIGLGRIPIDFYSAGLRTVLTFALPVAVLTTIPTKALFGLLSWQIILYSFLVGALFFLLSLRFWKYALVRYSSASS